MPTYEIPLTNEAQSLTIQLGAGTYKLEVEWAYSFETWIVHMNNTNGNRLLSSIPLVAGNDLLEPYAYMGLGGALYARTEGDVTLPPTYDNLGTLGRVYFVTK
jgi:hypothetical protein